MLPRGVRSIAVLVWLALFVAGCTSSPHVVKVTGTVTRGGKPVPNLYLNFIPADGRPSWGVTDEAGRYSLHYERNHEGAVTGSHKVWVQIRPRNPKEEQELQNGTLPLHPDVKDILEKYGKLETTPLEVQVKTENQVLDLTLD